MRLEIDVYEDSEGIWGYCLYKICDISFSDIAPSVYVRTVLTENHGFENSQSCIDSAHGWLRVTDLAVKYVESCNDIESNDIESDESVLDGRLASHCRLSSLKELEMRLSAQGESELWNDLASIWHISDDNCGQLIVGNYGGMLDIDEDMRLDLLAQYPEFAGVVDGGLCYLSDFMIYVPDRIYALVVVGNARCVVCVPRHPK